jgi:hypothetical protein
MICSTGVAGSGKSNPVCAKVAAGELVPVREKLHSKNTDLSKGCSDYAGFL